jgi:hypothetical protein
MSDFVEQLRLAEKAAEDIYFAKVSRKLIESLHKQRQAEDGPTQPGDVAQATTRPSSRLAQASIPVRSVKE